MGHKMTQKAFEWSLPSENERKYDAFQPTQHKNKNGS